MVYYIPNAIPNACILSVCTFGPKTSIVSFKYNCAIIGFVQAKKDYKVKMLLYFDYQTQRDGSRIYGLFKDADESNPEQYHYTLRMKATHMWTCGLSFSLFGSDGGLTDSEMSNLLNNPSITGRHEMVTVTELSDVYSDDGSVMISIEVSGGVADGEIVEWTWNYPYFTLTPGQSKGFYYAAEKQLKGDGSRVYSLVREYDDVDAWAHYYSIMVESDGVTKIATYTFKSNMLTLGECRNPHNTFYDSMIQDDF